MPRPRRRHDTTVSLFPFLSVLACVIGTLTLLIAALAIGQVASDLSAGDDTDPREVARLRSDVRGLRARIAAAERARGALSGARAALRARGLDPNAPRQVLDAKIAAMREDAALAARLPGLEREMREHETALGRARLDLDSLPAARSDAPIVLQPSGLGEALTPFFVECRPDALRIHRPDADWSIPLYLDDPADRARFERFLAGVRAEPRATVILLLRPESVGTYRRASRMLLSRSIRHGKLPIPSQGEIDFRLVRGTAS